MQSLDPMEAANAASNAVEHLDVVKRSIAPIGIAAVLWTFYMIRDLVKIETWKGRAVLYFSKLTTGTTAAYAMLLVLPYLPVRLGVPEQQIAALVGFCMGADAMEYIARRLFGFKTRDDDHPQPPPAQDASGGP